ncbi:unnamed protein product [Closterium sp. Yama58-4]|nr:unnamed protein product [Closterium sp. Yama58-4]
MLRPRQGRCDRSTVACDAAEWFETQKELQALLADPLLADVAADVSLEEVETLIAAETGGGMRLRVRRLDGGEYAVVVRRSATVGELKVAVEREARRWAQGEEAEAGWIRAERWRADGGAGGRGQAGGGREGGERREVGLDGGDLREKRKRGWGDGEGIGEGTREGVRSEEDGGVMRGGGEGRREGREKQARREMLERVEEEDSGGREEEGRGTRRVVLEEEGEVKEEGKEDEEQEQEQEEQEEQEEEEACAGVLREGYDYTQPSHSRGISWRYIWSHACLALDGHPLTFHSPTTPLLDLGLTNGDQLCFMPFRPPSNKRHRKARKMRMG